MNWKKGVQIIAATLVVCAIIGAVILGTASDNSSESTVVLFKKNVTQLRGHDIRVSIFAPNQKCADQCRKTKIGDVVGYPCGKLIQSCCSGEGKCNKSRFTERCTEKIPTFFCD